MNDINPLWPHQATELPNLVAADRLLAWEPGTGKTKVVLMAFRQILSGQADARMLVIVPANIRTQWVEVSRAEGFTVQEITKTTQAVDDVSEIVVVSYHAIVRPIVWQTAMRQKWAALSVDEAHYCKSPSSKWTKAIFGAKKNSPACLMRRAEHVWLMTGTPMTTDPSDLWVPVSRLYPAALDAEGISNKTEWVDRWCAGYNTPYGFRVTGAKDPDKLNALLQPFMSRVKKREALAHLKEPLVDRFRLPPRKIISETLPPEMQHLLEMLGDDAGDELLERLGDDPKVASLRRALGLSKVAEVAELIAEEMAETPGEKALVFFLHTDVGRQLVSAFDKAGLHPVMYDGKTSPAKKALNKRMFLTNDNVRVFVGQIQASGTGLDGLQTVARRVFIVEEPWTPGAMDQIVGRADRGGQEHQVHVTSFVVAGSYDDKVSRVLERRARMVSLVIDGEKAA